MTFLPRYESRNFSKNHPLSKKILSNRMIFPINIGSNFMNEKKNWHRFHHFFWPHDQHYVPNGHIHVLIEPRISSFKLLQSKLTLLNALFFPLFQNMNKTEYFNHVATLFGDRLFQIYYFFSKLQFSDRKLSNNLWMIKMLNVQN